MIARLLNAVSLLAAVLIFSGCAPLNHTHPPAPEAKPKPYRPPASLMQAAPTQYLLPPALQRIAP